MRCDKHRSGFTLIELLLLIGIIAVLAAIVILAVNPAEQLRKAFNYERTYNANQLRRAIEQFVIDYQELPGDSAISTDANSPSNICKLGQGAPGCINIDELVPKYVACIPYDDLETTPEFSGYQVYSRSGFIRVTAKHGNTEDSGGGGCTEQPKLIAYWPLDETNISSSLADNSGNNFTAVTANITAPHGPSTNKPALSFGNKGSWQFDGSEDYASVPHANAFNVPTALTITAWVYANGFSSSDVVNSILRKGEANPNTWQLAIEDGFVTLMLESGDGTNGRAQSTTSLTTGTWYHVAGTWDGATATVFINGVADGSGPYTGSNGGQLGTDTRPVYIGGRPTTDSFNGYLDDVRLYDIALTPTTIAKLASGWSIQN